MNLLAITGTAESAARGILYVIYEMLWKVIYHVLILIDEVTKLFYKVAGINVSGGVVENKNMFDQLLNQNVIGGWYGVFILFAAVLVVVFTLVAIIKTMANNEERKSVGPILKNVGLAVLLLIVLGPIVLLVISILSNLAIAIASIGGDNNISIAEIIFGNSGNLLTVYNETFTTEFTSFRDLGNGFLYDLMYDPKEGVSALSFHWYISLLGGGFVLYNLVCIVIEVVKRIFNIVVLYLVSPFAISKMALDDAKSFKDWQAKFFNEFLLLLSQMVTFMIFVALVNILNNIDLEGLATSEPADDSIIEGGLLEPNPDDTVEEVVGAYSLLNGLGRTLIIMAAVSVTRSSAAMLTNLLSSKESKTDSLLESVLNKMSSRGNHPVSRTRTITKNTTSTKRETVFVEANSFNSTNNSGGGFAANNAGRKIDTTTNNHITQNVNVNNKFSSVNNINNRTIREGIKKGGYAQNETPSNIYINTTKSVDTTGSSGTFKYMDNATNKAAENIAKQYDKVSNGLSSAIKSGDNSKIQQTLTEYTKAYSKEAEMLSKNYRQFETRASATMKSEVSSQTKQELKNITNSYRKAQMDYNKTASKLSKYEGERMSTAEALKIKEEADKQRERLMHASNKAAQFYENQKKGE